MRTPVSVAALAIRCTGYALHERRYGERELRREERRQNFPRTVKIYGAKASAFLNAIERMIGQADWAKHASGK
jgi:hypothetical protein